MSAPDLAATSGADHRMRSTTRFDEKGMGEGRWRGSKRGEESRKRKEERKKKMAGKKEEDGRKKGVEGERKTDRNKAVCAPMCQGIVLPQHRPK